MSAKKTAFERAVDALSAYKKKSAAKLEALEKAMVELCPHPPEGITISKVHHGYGKYIDVKHCGTCKWYSIWSEKWCKEYPCFRHDD